MALTHHVLIRLSALMAKEEPIYWLLGDDALIVGDGTFTVYNRILNFIGMQVSESKTFVSKHFFEFAKRFYLNGKEISPFPVEAVLNSKGDYSLLSVAMDNALTKSHYSLDEIVNTRIIDHFANIISMFGADKFRSRGPAKRLRRQLLMMSLKRKLQNGE